MSANPPDTLEQVIAEMRITIENLQDALLKVEWVRSHAKQWICAFCGGVSIESGGDDHKDGCEWQRLTGLSADRLAALAVQSSSSQRCDARCHVTGAVCELSRAHAQNHRGRFEHGIAQWPR